MRLISLSANKPTFHPVSFNRKGLSLIIGKQKAREDKKKAELHTYNGVGKSLLLYLINYCLGAEAREDFENSLAGWEFTLRVELDGREVRLIRKTGEEGIISFNGDRLNIEEFRDRLRHLVFPNSSD